jgi:hypothetical protein
MYLVSNKMATIFDNLIAFIETSAKKVSAWDDSPLQDIRKLSADAIGSGGEALLFNLCKKYGIDVEWDGNKNISKKGSSDRPYDMLIRGRKVEVKTARMGEYSTFQHETLSNDNSPDFWVFVDISPHETYFTVIDSYNLKSKHPILQRTAHSRKKTNDVYKLDTSECVLNKGMNSEITMKIAHGQADDAFGDWIRERIQPLDLIQAVDELSTLLDSKLSLLI